MRSTLSSPPSDADLDRLAHRGARAKLGWFWHAGIYLVVNAGLIALSVFQGRHWAVFPLLGWGIGLAAHGLAVWVARPGSARYDRMVAQERARLEAHRTPR